MLNGITDVMADAPWSTDAARLDDAVAAALTLDSLRGASPTDSKALIAAAEAARRLPWLLEAMQEPVGAPGGVTPRGLAVHILTTVPSADGLDRAPICRPRWERGSEPRAMRRPPSAPR